MWAHFKHLSLNIFPMISKTLQGNGFWPLQLHFEDSGIHLGLQFSIWEFTWECEGSFPPTLCTPKSRWCDSQVFLLARNLATPCFSRKPKARVTTTMMREQVGEKQPYHLLGHDGFLGGHEVFHLAKSYIIARSSSTEEVKCTLPLAQSTMQLLQWNNSDSSKRSSIANHRRNNSVMLWTIYFPPTANGCFGISS